MGPNAVVEHLDARLVASALASFLDRLDVEQFDLNAANFFPICDRDTGTNLVLTMRDLRVAFGSCTVAEVAAALRTPWNNARGRSGTLFAVLLRRLAEILELEGALDAALYALWLSDAASVSETIYDVRGPFFHTLRCAGEAASTFVAEGVGIAAQEALRGALAICRATQQLVPQQGEGGLDDPGSTALCMLLESFAAAGSSVQRASITSG